MARRKKKTQPSTDSFSFTSLSSMHISSHWAAPLKVSLIRSHWRVRRAACRRIAPSSSSPGRAAWSPLCPPLLLLPHSSQSTGFCWQHKCLINTTSATREGSGPWHHHYHSHLKPVMFILLLDAFTVLFTEPLTRLNTHTWVGSLAYPKNIGILWSLPPSLL